MIWCGPQTDLRPSEKHPRERPRRSSAASAGERLRGDESNELTSHNPRRRDLIAPSLSQAVADRYFIPAVVLAALVGYVAIYASGLADTPIRSDGFEYYVYAPALVLQHDPTLERFAKDCCAGNFPGPIGISRWPSTGRLVDRHTMGVAILVLPFFLVAHLLTLWANLPRDGFSLFYTHVCGLAAVFYLGAGLSLLKRLLRQYFRTGIVLVTLASIVWGTNLYHYATFDSLFSHVYSFFLLCCLLDLTGRWHAARSWTNSIKVGVVVGLIILVRAPNAVCFVLFALYGVVDLRTFKDKATDLLANWRHLAVIAIIVCVIQAPQLVIYHWASGSWFINPYGGQWFHFGSPKIVEVLLSPQKGLFFWSPILLVSVIGLFWMFELVRPFALGSLLVMLLTTYLIASWDDWQFGGSYGHRAFTDVLPLLALSMAAGYERLTNRRGWTLPLAVGVALTITLSVGQMSQYWLGIIPYRDTTWDTYRSVFLRFTR